MADGEISLGQFRFCPAKRELRRDGSPVRLGSRALDILCEFSRSQGETGCTARITIELRA